MDTLHALEEGGADIIELGVPFSDPIADGPIIQASSQRALEKGMTYDGVLDLVERAKLNVPVVLFSYLNPVLAAGADVTNPTDLLDSERLTHLIQRLGQVFDVSFAGARLCRGRPGFGLRPNIWLVSQI